MTARRDTVRPRPRWDLRVIAGLIMLATVVATAWGLGNAAQLAITRILFAVVVATYVAIGLLIIERRPGNRVGTIVFTFGALLGLYLVLDAIITGGDVAGGAQLAAWLVSLMDAPLFILIALLFLLFPDGHLPSPRWRVLLIADVALGIVVAAWAAFSPGPLTYFPQFENPFGREGAPLATIGPIAYVLVVGSVGLAALSLVGRWRRGGPVERAQLKWVASSALLLASTMGAYAMVIGPGRTDPLFDLLISIGFAGIPIAIGIAILRYHLFEIDRVVSRTISYAVVTALLVGTYAAVILILQGPLGAVTGGDTVSVALSTLVAAALFQPLRARVQSAVDRRFDRARFDAERTATSFAERLRHEVDIAMVTADLDLTVRSAIKPVSLGLWLREGAST